MTDREVAESSILLRLRCGACGAWRATSLHWWRAQSVQARLERAHRRDRQDMKDDLRRLSRGVEFEDFGLPGSRPSFFY